MSSDQDPFIDYFRDPYSDGPVPQVLPADLEDFESTVEELGMHVVHSFKTEASHLSIKGLVKLMERYQNFWPAPGDLAGPYVDSSSYPPVQTPGVRIYRIINHQPHAESGI